MSGKRQLTRESIIEAIAGGAKSLTKVAHAHGYVGSVSGGTSAEIRRLVPEVAQRMDGTWVEPAPAPARADGKTYRRLYGAVYDRALAAGEVPVREFIERAAAEIAVDGSPDVAKAVGLVRSRHPDADLVAQLRKAVAFAVGVIRTPKHQSNMGRSRDASEARGKMLIVPCEQEG